MSWRGRCRWRCSPPRPPRCGWPRQRAGRRPASAPSTFGAILNVPWLALGTVFLLAGRRIGDGVVGSRPGLRVRGGRPGHGSPPRSRAERRAAGRQRALRAAPPHPGRRRLRRGRPRRHRRGAVVGVASGPWPVVGRTQPGRERSAPRLRERGHRARHAGPVGQRARSPAGSGRTPRSRSRSWPASSCCSADSSSPRQGGRPAPPGGSLVVAPVGQPMSPALVGAAPAGAPCRKGCGAARPRTAPWSGTCSGPGGRGVGDDSSSSRCTPASGTTAFTASPVWGWVTPTTATSATPGSSAITSSTSAGKTLKPDTMMRSLARSTNQR